MCHSEYRHKAQYEISTLLLTYWYSVRIIRIETLDKLTSMERHTLHGNN